MNFYSDVIIEYINMLPASRVCDFILVQLESHYCKWLLIKCNQWHVFCEPPFLCCTLLIVKSLFYEYIQMQFTNFGELLSNIEGCILLDRISSMFIISRDPCWMRAVSLSGQYLLLYLRLSLCLLWIVRLPGGLGTDLVVLAWELHTVYVCIELCKYLNIDFEFCRGKNVTWTSCKILGLNLCKKCITWT